jgi:hypothetical protein
MCIGFANALTWCQGIGGGEFHRRNEHHHTFVCLSMVHHLGAVVSGSKGVRGGVSDMPHVEELEGAYCVGIPLPGSPGVTCHPPA